MNALLVRSRVVDRRLRDSLQDYHVILIDKSSSPPLIYDFDTALPFPTDASNYLLRSIRSETRLAPPYHRYCFVNHVFTVFNPFV